MSLERSTVPAEGGARDERRAKRDPQKYYVSIFRHSAETGTWVGGWKASRVLNYTIKDGEGASSTPNSSARTPARSTDRRPNSSARPRRGHARAILKLCDAEQQNFAWIDKGAPDDFAQPRSDRHRIRLPATRKQTVPVVCRLQDELGSEEICWAICFRSIQEHAGPRRKKNARRASSTAGSIKSTSPWWGDADQHKRHYYRVTSPTFLIEIQQTLKHANHVHIDCGTWAAISTFPLPNKLATTTSESSANSTATRTRRSSAQRKRTSATDPPEIPTEPIWEDLRGAVPRNDSRRALLTDERPVDARRFG